MTLDDIPAVVALEGRAMNEGWHPGAYAHELEHNGAARYLVAESEGVVAGFAGLWLQFDQAHVVTVAVEPAMQRKGIGSLLVLALLSVAEEAGMEDATLEVRTSNVAARALYRGFGFFEVGVRKKYYLDNGEDAVIMTTEAIASDGYKRRVAKMREDILSRAVPSD
jgi:ribosomal-protein-alanine N-acetyltransferase